MTFFLLQNTKEDIQNNIGSQTFLATIDFHNVDFKKNKKKHLRYFSKYIILCFCVSHKEENHTVLEQYESE